MTAAPGRIRTGIGGWVFPAWRGGTFYPAGLAQREELAHASRALGCIEINSTFYRAQKPAVYAQWREQTPPGFRFSAKAPRTITQTHDLSRVGARAEAFIDGIVTLGDRLGPLVWQFGDTHPAAAPEFDGFLQALPREADGHRLQHALEVRNPAAWTPELVAVARAHNVALVFSGSNDYPSFADPTADFVYARLMHARANLRAGYPERALEQWCLRAMRWARGDDNPDLPHVAAEAPARGPREVYVLFIGAAKQRNPGAAMALREQLSRVGAT
ncbi:DUF72 domain-containing protein [Stenotrophomonas rhizophila]|uniref:DUF72 domain-containing protein n=1 Tax=Stenotrophomonas sp. BIGb0135 TaxID=2940620 RepID=UPI00216905ED|nr:DUF72 domain-containing protein [Stenotrophomonas sp. BIGb0135]MCS4234071.1 uncharacterized protein YecE (DUF72 family) [Stenotrophomonas sp. BIGb0135]